MDQAVETDTQADPRLVLNATCVVSLRKEGPCIERNNVVWPIDHPRLEVLALLSRPDAPGAVEVKDAVVEMTGAPEPDLATFVMDLIYAGHLSAGEPVRGLEPLGRDTPGTAEPADLDSSDEVRIPTPKRCSSATGSSSSSTMVAELSHPSPPPRSPHLERSPHRRLWLPPSRTCPRQMVCRCWVHQISPAW